MFRRIPEFRHRSNVEGDIWSPRKVGGASVDRLASGRGGSWLEFKWLAGEFKKSRDI